MAKIEQVVYSMSNDFGPAVYVKVNGRLYFGWMTEQAYASSRPYRLRALKRIASPGTGELDPFKRIAQHKRSVVPKCRALRGLPKHPPFTDPVWQWN